MNRFASRSADRRRPFFQLLKKWKGFKWTLKCDEAFQNLKKYLASPPILSSPEPREDLYVYLVVYDYAVSAMLIRLVYYINKTLVDSETRYPLLEKMALALVHATRKIPHYFQDHIVYVLTEHPLQALLRRFDFTRRITKWRTRLKSFDIRYKPRNAIKGQLLAYFVVEFTPTILMGNFPNLSLAMAGICRQCF